ncbi:hypothetical protein L202_03084 [Cryptococcus amylolentus CBS 6039]|uniref:Thaumatin-like protein n=1 Tax=Cryptococcus amylolentus CBS 6039 TaxID=1295533 RepID=A0A1E3HXD8_9TREE|nr:hypothetical protein L202_03084 [Cryptococcus amylolentus CBS 6039]ODN80974.1 hypothetical protein L202_03084 [Cryptococcus amylolentus CBS 6039]
MLSHLLLPLLSSTLIFASSITISNKCSSSLYIGVGGQGGSITKTDGSAQDAGWEQQPGEYTFNLPDGWNNGRIWARTGCEKDGDGINCVIGGCKNNAIACDGIEYGTAGATLAEISLNQYMGQDFYDISIVDGYNLPMTITPSDSSCTPPSCGADTDILTQCDPSLVYPKGNDKIYSCNSACGNSIEFQDKTRGALVNADPLNSPVCCQKNGVTVDHKDCPDTYIPFYKKMKSMCNDAYVYSDDDMYQDAVFGCAFGTDYTVVFCPNGDGAGLNPPESSSAVSQDTAAGDNSGNLQGGGDTSDIW